MLISRTTFARVQKRSNLRSSKYRTHREISAVQNSEDIPFRSEEEGRIRVRFVNEIVISAPATAIDAMAWETNYHDLSDWNYAREFLLTFLRLSFLRQPRFIRGTVSVPRDISFGNAMERRIFTYLTLSPSLLSFPYLYTSRFLPLQGTRSPFFKRRLADYSFREEFRDWFSCVTDDIESKKMCTSFKPGINCRGSKIIPCLIRTGLFRRMEIFRLIRLQY